MEINIQIKNVQKPEDVITAFAAIGQGQAFGQGQAAASSSRNRPPIQRASREAMATTAATRRSPSLILSQRELDALQKVHPRGGKDVHSSTDAADDTDRTVATSSGVSPKMRPQPFSVFQRPARHHQGRTLSPRPYYQRGDQVGAADRVTTPRPTRAPLALPDLEQTRAPSRPLLVRKCSKSREEKPRSTARPSTSRSPLKLRSRPRQRKAPPRSRMPRTTSRSRTPRATSRSRTPRATSRSCTPRASSRSPAATGAYTASSSKAPYKAADGGSQEPVRHSKDAYKDHVLQEPPVLRG